MEQVVRVFLLKVVHGWNPTSEFIASGVLPIHRENLPDLYLKYFQESPPAEITKYY